MSGDRIELGRAGEETAADFLKNHGYRILFSNYKTKLGEIDIIAKDKGVICFIEVKTRTTDKFGLPQEAVSHIKQRQIGKAALVFLKEKKLLDKKARFDVVSVIYAQGRPKIDLIQNAFELNESFTY